MNIRNILKLLVLPVALLLPSCEKYLDVVPDGIAVIEQAFTMRATSERYLFTCYSYMNKSDANLGENPAILGGDELWTIAEPPLQVLDQSGVYLAQGKQTAQNVLFDVWSHYYKAIRDCNIFLENIGSVPNLEAWERDQWRAEAQTLKAYYHFLLLRQYGPIPVVRENIPVSADITEVRTVREPVDDVVNYIVDLLDEAAPRLPVKVLNPASELGRIVRPVAVALKARVLVYAASPLFNGNTEQAALHNLDGTQLFNQTKMPEKWTRAVAACEVAINLCDSTGMALYEYPGNPAYHLTDTILRQLTLRNAFTERWNSDIIWANTQTQGVTLQSFTAPQLSSNTYAFRFYKIIGVPIKMAELFYSENGVPIEEDKTWNYNGRYALRGALEADKLYIVKGNKTVNMHFNREPRFYAWVGFDEGIWYGQGQYNDADASRLYLLNCKFGAVNGMKEPSYGPVTGYFPKKYIHFENVEPADFQYTVYPYAWPLFRLSDLYLLYAEALNEAGDSEANRSKAIGYIDKIRARAGLKSVETSWSNYSNDYSKFRSQNGLRKIIQQERMIELSFEGHRFWDVRRWMIAPEMYGQPIEGWDLKQRLPDLFYRPVNLQSLNFYPRDYFWPIKETDILTNRNLVQNLGWQ